MDKKEKLNDELYRHQAIIRHNQTENLNVNGDIIEGAIKVGIASLIVAFDVGVCHLSSNEAIDRALTICGGVFAVSQIPKVAYLADSILHKYELKKEIKVAKEKIVNIVGEQVDEDLLDSHYNVEYMEKKGKIK